MRYVVVPVVNAFWLDRNLEQTARWLVDSHVTSSVFECSMVLTTAVQLRGYDEEGLSFTHSKHPLTQWAARALENWEYLREYTACAHEEWRYRWNHGADEYHGSWASVRRLNDDRIAALDWTDDPGDPPQVVGDWGADDYVDAYRLYYANEKRHLFEWAKNRRPPPWLDEYRRE